MNRKIIATFAKTWLLLLFVATVFASIQNARGAGLIITLNTSKASYRVGEEVTIFGNVTLDDVPITDALVAIEVDDPEGNPVILRTCSTGTTPTGLDIEILSVIPCDHLGNPKSSFEIGTLAFFKITLYNYGSSPKYAVMCISVLDENNVPFEALVSYRGLVYLGRTEFVVPINIPYYLPVGCGVVYVGAFTELPKNGGAAYCPEKLAIFEIVQSGAGKMAETEGFTPTETARTAFYSTSTEGTYTVGFRLRRTGGRVGDYPVYAGARFQSQTATNTTTFVVFLEGDLNGDKKVDMRDIGIVARVFGATPSDPLWDPVADLNCDLKIDMRDIGIVARNFGASAL